MRFANQARVSVPEKIKFTKSKVPLKTRFLSHGFFFSLLIAAVGGGMSVAQAQSCSIYQGAGGNWFSTVVAAAQSDLPQFYCESGYCATDFSVDVSSCQQASNWICAYNWSKIDAPGSNYCEQLPARYCGPQSPLYNLVGLVGSGPCQVYWVTAQKNNETCSGNCVGDPINPGPGNVYKREDDDVSVSGASPIEFRRYYNSADTTQSDMGAGWHHSYSRSISANSYPTVVLTASGSSGQSGLVSAQYSDPATACTSGFADIQGSVSAWNGASAAFTGSVCVISNGGNTVGTLRVYSLYWDSAQSTPVEYNIIRDDGKILRYTTQGGIINAPPGVSLRLAVTSSGFTLTDDQDNFEVYNSGGVLQSITSRSGIVQTITHDQSGRWTGVTDSFGNSMAIGLNSGSLIASASINGGTAVQFAYDSSNRLAIVTNADSTTHTYGYTNSTFPNALTSEVDESGTTYATWNYDSQERATSSSLAGGANAVSLVYNYPNSTTVTDALGAVRTFSFGRFGEAMPVIAIGGVPCLFNCADAAATTYDSAGWVSSRTDYNGNVTCYANDQTRGLELVRVEGFAPGSTCPTNLSSYTPTAGTTQRKISTTWSATFQLPTLIVEPTRSITFNYDGSGNLFTRTVTDTTVSPNVSRTWTYTYNSVGQVLTAQGPRTDLNSTKTYAYYACTSGTQCGQIQTVTDELGHVTTFNTYNAYGQPLTITDPNGLVTTLSYDARQRLISSSKAGEVTSFAYYPTGLLRTITMPDGSYLQCSYDPAHRLTGITDGLGNQISYTLDALGNHTATQSFDASNALTFSQSQVFNTLSLPSQQIGSAGTAAVTTTFGYDPNGNQTSIAAPLSRHTGKQYDALNRLIQATDPASGVTGLGYDINDNLISVQDPRGLGTGYAYNGFGDLITQVSPDTGTTTKTYDSGGNLATSTDARGAVGAYTYDALNRVTQIAYSDQTINYTYDAGTNGVGHLTGASDVNHSMAWTYDPLGRVTGKTQATAGITKSIAYDYTNGDLTSIVTPSGQTINYTYTNHQITTIKVNGTTLLSSVTYEPFGAPNGWTWSNGAVTTKTFDQDGMPSTIITPGLTANVTNVFTVDAGSRITGITDSGTSTVSETYGYDLLDRVTSGVTSAQSTSFTYDANGNRITTPTATLTIDPKSNRISAIAGNPARTYGYDAAGNTTSYTGATFTYNQRGRMSSAAVTAGTTNYIYNALGQLIEKSGNGGTTLLVYDEAGHLMGEYSSTGALIQETVWMGDTPVATLRPNGSPLCTSTLCIFYVHTDQLGTPRKVEGPLGNNLEWRWDPNTFGASSPQQTIVYNLRFAGQYFLPETGLFYNYFRDYDPATGRYVESDPIGLNGGSYSTYAYVGGNPITNIDPNGEGPLGYAIGSQIGGWAAGILGSETGPFDVAIAAGGRYLGGLAGDALENWALANSYVNDPAAQAEYDAYKTAYAAPPPPGLDPCEMLNWQLQREQNLLQARQAWDAKWLPGRHAAAIEQSKRAIANLKDKMRKAGCSCP